VKELGILLGFVVADVDVTSNVLLIDPESSTISMILGATPDAPTLNGICEMSTGF
jgi:hypothetical protein